MKEVYRSSNPASVALFQSLLGEAGIPYFVRNEATQQGVGVGWAAALFPLPDFWPALCVLNDEDYPRAMELLQTVHETAPALEGEWKCPHCGEAVPANFTSCWNCGAEKKIAG